MFMSFIAGLVFGVGSGVFEKAISGPLRKRIELSDSEVSLVSFAGLMLLAAILVSAMNFDSSAFWLVFGGVVGAFSIRSFVFGKSKMEERRLAAQEAASDLGEETVSTLEDAAEDVSTATGEIVEDVSEAADDMVKATKSAAEDVKTPA